MGAFCLTFVLGRRNKGRSGNPGPFERRPRVPRGSHLAGVCPLTGQRSCFGFMHEPTRNLRPSQAPARRHSRYTKRTHRVTLWCDGVSKLWALLLWPVSSP